MNNAGIGDGGDALSNPDAWTRVMGVNFFGVLHVVQAFVPAMADGGAPGLVVNTGSKQGITQPPGNTAYNVSKSAVKALTEGLAHTLRTRPGCRVSAHLLIPGFTYTRMTADGRREPPGMTLEQVVDWLLDGIAANEFYVLRQDGETTREQDERRISGPPAISSRTSSAVASGWGTRSSVRTATAPRSAALRLERRLARVRAVSGRRSVLHAFDRRRMAEWHREAQHHRWPRPASVRWGGNDAARDLDARSLNAKRPVFVRYATARAGSRDLRERCPPRVAVELPTITIVAARSGSIPMRWRAAGASDSTAWMRVPRAGDDRRRRAGRPAEDTGAGPCDAAEERRAAVPRVLQDRVERGRHIVDALRERRAAQLDQVADVDAVEHGVARMGRRDDDEAEARERHRQERRHLGIRTAAVRVDEDRMTPLRDGRLTCAAWLAGDVGRTTRWDRAGKARPCRRPTVSLPCPTWYGPGTSDRPARDGAARERESATPNRDTRTRSA
jgi:hypothetical protein